MDGPRACLPHELPALIAAANRIFRPSGGDMGRDYPLLLSAANLDNLRVIADGETILAHAGLCVRTAALGGVRVAVGALGAVFTHQDHRHRGLGGAVAGDALARARAAAADLALVSGGGPLYRGIGFAPVPEARCWDCPPAGDEGREIHVRPGREEDLDRLARLNDAEPVHFVRGGGDWRAVMHASVIFAWPARLWLVYRGAEAVGYLVVAQRTRRRVLELAGDRAALLEAAPLVSDELVAPWHDAETTDGARRLGWRERGLPLGWGSQWLCPPGRPLPLPWYGLNYV